MSYIIVKSSNKRFPNWSGKEFSSLPAKVYSSYEEAFYALQGYWFGRETFHCAVSLKPLTEKEKDVLFKAGKIRW